MTVKAAKKRTSAATNRLNLPDGTGRAGEAAAADVLRRNGYEILRSNYRTAEGEIDIVARHKKQMVFVEVKTRRSHSFGLAEESMTPTKVHRLVAAAQTCLAESDQLQADWRIDLLAIQMDRRGRVLNSNIIENAVSE